MILCRTKWRLLHMDKLYLLLLVLRTTASAFDPSARCRVKTESGEIDLEILQRRMEQSGRIEVTRRHRVFVFTPCLVGQGPAFCHKSALCEVWQRKDTISYKTLGRKGEQTVAPILGATENQWIYLPNENNHSSETASVETSAEDGDRENSGAENLDAKTPLKKRGSSNTDLTTFQNRKKLIKANNKELYDQIVGLPDDIAASLLKQLDNEVTSAPVNSNSNEELANSDSFEENSSSNESTMLNLTQATVSFNVPPLRKKLRLHPHSVAVLVYRSQRSRIHQRVHRRSLWFKRRRKQLRKERRQHADPHVSVITLICSDDTSFRIRSLGRRLKVFDLQHPCCCPARCTAADKQTEKTERPQQQPLNPADRRRHGSGHVVEYPRPANNPAPPPRFPTVIIRNETAVRPTLNGKPAADVGLTRLFWLLLLSLVLTISMATMVAALCRPVRRNKYKFIPITAEQLRQDVTENRILASDNSVEFQSTNCDINER